MNDVTEAIKREQRSRLLYEAYNMSRETIKSLSIIKPVVSDDPKYNKFIELLEQTYEEANRLHAELKSEAE